MWYGVIQYFVHCTGTGHLNVTCYMCVTVFVSTRVTLCVCAWCPCYNYYIMQLYSGAAVSVSMLGVLGLGSGVIYYCIIQAYRYSACVDFKI